MPTRVAIVDDSSTIRRLIRSFIESHTDWEVCGEAEDGNAAVSLAECLKPDLVVLDFSMPKKNGLGCCTHDSRCLPRVTMVLFTAHATKELTIEAERVGIRAVIAKDGSTSLERVVTALRHVGETRQAA